MFYLYKIDVPGGLSYFGVTQNPKVRFKTHCSANTRVGEAIRECGRENVAFTIMAAGEREYIYDLEFNAVRHFNTRCPNGYNVSSGGFGGRDQLPRHRERIGVAHRGKVLSAEHRAKLSAAKRKPEAIASLVARNKRGPSDETRLKLATSHLGKKPSAETRAKMSAARMGRPVSPETRAKLSAAMARRYGKPMELAA